MDRNIAKMLFAPMRQRYNALLQKWKSAVKEKSCQQPVLAGFLVDDFSKTLQGSLLG
ncbi:MAG: hypothetical protein ACOYLR_07990 [Chlorobium sp.]